MIDIKIFLVANIVIAAAFGITLHFTRTDAEAILTALTALIAFTPFTLALGINLALKYAARLVEDLGVRMKSAATLIKLCTIDTAAFSMNKMLTTGEYFITDLIPEGLTQAALLSIAASAERDSKHPLGRKIFETAEGRGLRLDNATMCNEFEGNGVEALINGTTVRVGRPAWVKGEGARISVELRTKIDQIAAKSRTPLLLSMGQTARGVIGLKDELDERATIFLDRLKFNGLETVLLTAEPKKKAQVLCKGLPIDVVRAELLPEDKAREIQLMQARGRQVLMLSSDAKDTPAFSAADVSILIGDGGFNGFEEFESVSGATDFVISDAAQLFELRTIANRTQKILRLNRRLTFATWLLMVPLIVLTAIGSVPWAPLVATGGAAICAALIVVNSRRLIPVRAVDV